MADPGPSTKKQPNNVKSASNRQPTDKQDLDQKHTKAFDFTQRKRWADILVNELSGAVMLVLSTAAKIVFVGEAARELLNWNDTNVQGMEFTALLHPDDQDPFIKDFGNCIRDQAELAIFVRLKSCHGESALNLTGGKWPLYEIRGHPHFGAPNASAPFAMGSGFPQMECKGFFATARPYPTRGSAVLDNFLELKVENERLRRNLEELRIAHPDIAAAVKEDAAVAASSSSTRRRLDKDQQQPTLTRSADDIAVDSNGGGSVPNPFAYDFSFPAAAGFGSNAAGGGVVSVPATGEDINMMRRHSVAGITGDDAAASSKKRGKRKAAGLEQRVCHTCGRTDSPEWRKGPLGPKTLCNACGLRFSKKVKTKPSDSSNDKDDQLNGADGDDAPGEDDADGSDNIVPTLDNRSGSGTITQSPVMHHELDFSRSFSLANMGAPPPAPLPPPNAKLHQLSSSSHHHSFSTGLLPTPPQAFHPSSPTATTNSSGNYFPVSMTMSMPNHLSEWFASGATERTNGGGGPPGGGGGGSYDLTGYAPLENHPIRAPQPKQGLPQLQTHFGYDPSLASGGGSSSALSASIPTSGPMYHHYQPPGGQAR